MQAVIAHGRGGTHAFLDVAILQDAAHLVGAPRPEAGQAIGLEFGADGGGVVLAVAQQAQQVLHVVSDLVGKHIGLREIAGGAQTLLHLAEEGEIDVNAAVGRAIKGPHGGLGVAAARLHAARKQHQARRLVALVVAGEFGRPDVFGAGQHPADEAGMGILARGGRGGLLLLLRGRRTAAAFELREDDAGVHAEQERDDHNGHEAKPAHLHPAPAAAAATLAAAVFEVGTLAFIVEFHSARPFAPIRRVRGCSRNWRLRLRPY